MNYTLANSAFVLLHVFYQVDQREKVIDRPSTSSATRQEIADSTSGVAEMRVVHAECEVIVVPG